MIELIIQPSNRQLQLLVSTSFGLLQNMPTTSILVTPKKQQTQHSEKNYLQLRQNE
ncbi:4710_t:CDS:2 [Funneliformis geosporum]|uniref:4710_t:CDS:1 n=1 Tax=Funneliformis geosporum TaxID=1117311 RepID=A0A9W4SS28_9GLOM|nr:4710_t:CDS:2 [Funneliformis geosporum]